MRVEPQRQPATCRLGADSFDFSPKKFPMLATQRPNAAYHGKMWLNATFARTSAQAPTPTQGAQLAYTDRTDENVDWTPDAPVAPTADQPYDGGVYEPQPRLNPAARRDTRAQGGGERPAVLPAHPLPMYRSGKIDYDRYLEASSNKFKIFSAETRRQRNKAIATGVAIAALVAIIVIWAVLSK